MFVALLLESLTLFLLAHELCSLFTLGDHLFATRPTCLVDTLSCSSVERCGHETVFIFSKNRCKHDHNSSFQYSLHLREEQRKDSRSLLSIFLHKLFGANPAKSRREPTDVFQPRFIHRSSPSSLRFPRHLSCINKERSSR